MTKGIIEHPFEFVKGNSEKIPARVFDALAKHDGVNYKVAAQVLKGTPDRAYEHLKVLGYKGGLPITMQRLADFYGVRGRYLNCMYRAFRVGTRVTPTCIYRQSDGTLCVDPRIALAIGVIMLHGRTVPDGMVGERVRNGLLNSVYFDEVMKAGEEPAEEKKPEIDGVTINQDGSFVISPEFLQAVVQKVAQDAVRSVINETAERPAEKPQQPYRKEKPKNWEKVVGLYNEKKLTQVEAASVLGMCPSTFKKYTTMAFHEATK